jgi:hypothetical protein
MAKDVVDFKKLYDKFSIREDIEGKIKFGILLICDGSNPYYDLYRGIDLLKELGKLDFSAYFHLFLNFILRNEPDYINAFEMFKLYDPYLFNSATDIAYTKNLEISYMIHARNIMQFLKKETDFMHKKTYSHWINCDICTKYMFCPHYELTEYDIIELKSLRKESEKERDAIKKSTS